MSTTKRKKSHIDIALKQKVTNQRSSAGFDDIELIPCALPELDINKIDTTEQFLKKKISAPFIIDAMTGGHGVAKEINKSLATAAEEAGIVFAVGSQRAMIENPALKETYFVRDVAPNIPLIGNIGAVNLKEDGMIQKIEGALKDIDADALAVHVNPLQEALQPEGDRNFEGCISAIAETCSSIDVPVIVKEVGTGIDGEVAKKLDEAGIAMLNVAGAGGTSWSRIELERGDGRLKEFSDMGLPTIVALVDALRSTRKPLIASGGVRNGYDSVKCIALGAHYTASALPFLRAWKEKKIKETIDLWKEELRVAMFMAGTRDLHALRKIRPLITGRSAELINAMERRRNRKVWRESHGN